MARLYDITAIAEGDKLIAFAFANNPNLKIPNYEDIEMIVKENETRVVGIRFPVELLEWIDRYSRILAVDENKRVTRNQVVIGFLESMKSIVEYREQHEFNGSHVEEIEKVIELARKQQHEEIS